ncbi:MAG TPA: response regulator [Polyangia bacterium]|nr:response regulator [Polyangia bacterium]
MTNLFSDASSDADRPAQGDNAGWVLVVDDDDDNRDATVDLLNDAGYDARGVSGGTDALAALMDDRPCLVLVDLVMRDMDGRELLLEARRRLDAPIPPFVFVTGAGPSKLEDISGLILTKPVDVDRLLGVVALHCAG